MLFTWPLSSILPIFHTDYFIPVKKLSNQDQIEEIFNEFISSLSEDVFLLPRWNKCIAGKRKNWNWIKKFFCKIFFLSFCLFLLFRNCWLNREKEKKHLRSIKKDDRRIIKNWVRKQNVVNQWWNIKLNFCWIK